MPDSELCNCGFGGDHECYCTGEECFNYKECVCPCHEDSEWKHD